MAIHRVWIEEGACICCQACTSAEPRVFEIVDGTAIVIGRAREDGVGYSNQDAQSPLLPSIAAELADSIAEAVEGCPIEIIHMRTI